MRIVVITADGISTPTTARDPFTQNQYYDLQGRRVDASLFTPHSSLRKGIYIRDGKKILK